MENKLLDVADFDLDVCVCAVSYPNISQISS